MSGLLRSVAAERIAWSREQAARANGRNPIASAMFARYADLMARYNGEEPFAAGEREAVEQEMKILRGLLPVSRDYVDDADIILEGISFAMHDAGYSAFKSAAVRKDALSGGLGRGRSLDDKWLSIVALEWHLDGKTDSQIANEFCRYDPDGEHCHTSTETRDQHKSGSRGQEGKENKCVSRFRKRRNALLRCLESECGWTLTGAARPGK